MSQRILTEREKESVPGAEPDEHSIFDSRVVPVDGARGHVHATPQHLAPFAEKFGFRSPLPEPDTARIKAQRTEEQVPTAVQAVRGGDGRGKGGPDGVPVDRLSCGAPSSQDRGQAAARPQVPKASAAVYLYGFPLSLRCLGLGTRGSEPKLVGEDWMGVDPVVPAPQVANRDRPEDTATKKALDQLFLHSAFATRCPGHGGIIEAGCSAAYEPRRPLGGILSGREVPLSGCERLIWALSAILAFAAGGIIVGRSSKAAELVAQNQQLVDSGKTKIRLGNLSGAIQDFGSVLETDGNNLLALRLRGLARQASGDLEGAIEDLNAAIRLNPQEGFAFNTRGVVLMEKKDYVHAIEDFSRAVGANGGNAIIRFNRALAREQIGDWNGVAADCENGLVLWQEGRAGDELIAVGRVWRSPQEMIIEMAKRLQNAKQRKASPKLVSAQIY